MTEGANTPDAAQRENPDPVDQVLERIKEEEMPHDSVLEALDALHEKIRAQNVRVSREQLARLRAETTEEVQRDIASDNIDEQWKDSTLQALDDRLKAIEQQADRRPEWIKKSERMGFDLWKKFRAMPGVGDTLDWIGEMTGKAWNNAEDVWASIKGYVLGALADEKLTKDVPFVGKKVSEWAKMKLKEEAVVEGIQFSMTKARKGQIIIGEDPKKVSHTMKAKFDTGYSSDDIRAWQDVLTTGNWGELTPQVATAYVDAYIKKYAPQDSAQELSISIDALVKAHLAKPTSTAQTTAANAPAAQPTTVAPATPAPAPQTNPTPAATPKS